MPNIAYLQCATGIAGDMLLGAMIDAGVPLEYIAENLASLNLTDEYNLAIETVSKNGQSATQLQVNLNQHNQHHHRHLPDIEKIINQANLPTQVKSNSLAIFGQLAIAEAKVHGTTVEKVHFHEVGATDAIVDIVGCCLGMYYLQINKLYCSALPTGGGMVKAAHGELAVPVPAVLQLWQTREVPVYSNGINKELVTPTGAAIVTTLAVGFGQPPPMKLTKIGMGAGNRNLPIPNVLRFWLGKEESSSTLEEVAVLETQIDDCNPQIIGYVLEELLQQGARDVFTQPVTMKKNRLGVLLTVICDLDKIAICEEIIFRETTTIGIRRQIQPRSILAREIKTVKTDYGEVRVKFAQKGEQIINIQPEYADCVRLAREHQIPFSVISASAYQVASRLVGIK